MAANTIGHDAPGHDLVHVHRNFMLVTTSLGVGLAILGWAVRDPSSRVQATLAAASVVLVGVMTLGAARGAAMVFVHGIGVASDASEQTDTSGTQTESDGHGSHSH